MSNRPTKLLFGMFLDCGTPEQVRKVEYLHQTGHKSVANHLMLRAIVKRWVELHNGKTKVKKKPETTEVVYKAITGNGGFHRLSL
jgi:hypothetical protein